MTISFHFVWPLVRNGNLLTYILGVVRKFDFQAQNIVVERDRRAKVPGLAVVLIHLENSGLNIWLWSRDRQVNPLTH